MGGFQINNVLAAVATTDAPNLTQMQAADAVVLATAVADIAASQTAILAAVLPAPPTGRLTLTTLTPLLFATVAAATAVFYTPAGPNTLPLWNGSAFQNFAFAELTNTLANGATGNAGPLAAQPNSVYDLFVWQVPTVYTGNIALGSNSITSLSSVVGLAIGQPVTGAGIPANSTISNIVGSTVTISPLPATATATAENITFYANALTRGDMWSKTATVTIPTASPAVVNWTAHGLLAGCPVRFSAATLPTGLTLGVTYFVSATGLTTNAFQISASVGGGSVNVTGAGSGAITAIAGTGGFGVSNGALGTEARGALNGLGIFQGILVNSNSIANGPGANLGVYVGTIMTDATGATVTFNPGSAASGGGAGWIGFWNAYNQKTIVPTSVDTSAPHVAVNTGSYTAPNNSTTFKVTFINGLPGDYLQASYSSANLTGISNSSVSAAVGFDASTPSGVYGFNRPSTTGFAFCSGFLARGVPIGAHVLQALEYGDTAADTMNENSNATLAAQLVF